MKGEGDEIRLARDEPGGSMPALEVRPVAQLKCIYNYIHSVDNK